MWHENWMYEIKVVVIDEGLSWSFLKLFNMV